MTNESGLQNAPSLTAEDVLRFWFEELSPADWFRKSDELDRRIAERFGPLLTAARAGELSHWRNEPRGRLAEVIVLDQFSRNIFRDQAESFAADNLALALAQEAVRAGADKELGDEEKSFLYMPYMHSESAVVHEEAVRLFSQPGLENNLDFEHRHLAIIKRFGRYPHRNAILGRESTPEELAFLKEPGSGF
ncbi:uncharacterized protein conserved in bacteria [Hahella chejuensis KCTC 2396]|uniref:Uncharacterized protein conserved in bacteria n=1 Tax=Hahella chejuensis (strain KCTC 2396) TaxID=349521 RepID=Q2SQF9_HAHCH|nr:DUF924 family protein [Hahella chejuensis]ABC27115.1 uncharacterized protein conserved in bacteria [Hahella chejuensis KCTC 2396]